MVADVETLKDTLDSAQAKSRVTTDRSIDIKSLCQHIGRTAINFDAGNKTLIVGKLNYLIFIPL